jgi:hypothetical protein
MTRLYYLVPSMSEVEDISRDLHQQGVTDWCFHTFCKDEAGLYTEKLHSADVLERSELFRFMERGVIVGALIGGSVIVALALFTSLYLPLAAWASMFVFSVIAGAWLGGIGGISSGNDRVKHFDGAMCDGSYLVMIDVPRQQVERMKADMRKNHPKAKFQTIDSSAGHPGHDRESHA